MKKIQLSDVFKKDLKIIAFLAGSWLVGLAVYFCEIGTFPANLGLLGLIPLFNYIAYRLKEELQKEGYLRALEK